MAQRYEISAKTLARKTLRIEGRLRQVEWAEFFERLKVLLRQYGISLTTVRK